MIRKIPVFSMVAALLLAAGACSSQFAGRPGLISGEWTAGLERLAGPSTQVLLVSNLDPSSSRAAVYALDKKGSGWEVAMAPIPATIGKKGFAAPGSKREGDGKTPSGIYPLGTVFGYAESAQTRMPYRQAARDDIWVDDASSGDYNRWAKRGATGDASYEDLRRQDDLYKFGIVIEYNMRPVVKGMGSAIFIHLWRGEGVPTEGCVALSERSMLRILDWLNPKSKPLVIMGAQNTLKGFLP